MGFFGLKKGAIINVSRSAAPKLALVPASSNNCDIYESNVNICAKFHLDLKGFRRGPFLKLNKGLIFRLKITTASLMATPGVKIDFTFGKTWYKSGALLTPPIARNR